MVKNSKDNNEKRPFSLNKAEFQEAYKKLKKNTAPFRQTFSQPETSVAVPQPVIESPVQPEINVSVSNQVQKVNKKIELESVPSITNENQEQKIVDAIIWSEILGEPRARKPHYLKNRR